MDTFSIEWKNFGSHLINYSKELLSENNFTDVTLVSGDMKTVKAHRIVLSRASGVLKRLLEINPSAYPLLYLKGISSANITSILEFIYAGQTQVPAERINDFIKASDELEISEFSTNQELYKNSWNFMEKIEKGPLQIVDNVATDNSNPLMKDDVSSFIIENKETLCDLDNKFIVEDVVVKKKLISQNKRNSKGERKSSFKINCNTLKEHNKNSSVKEYILKKQDNIKTNNTNCSDKIDSLKEKSNMKEETWVKEDTLYKIDELVCSRCFEIFSDQILYLKHMAQYSS